MMKAGLVLTTINDAICLEGYYENFKKFGHLEQVKVFVIADVKTPPAAFERCVNLAAKGLQVTFSSFSDQERSVKDCGLRIDMFPLNSDNRRNIGYLQALAAGVDFVISIDDDNYCLQEHDYFANHELVMWSGSETVSTDIKWLNPCDGLSAGLYQRGFPYFARHCAGSGRRNKVSVQAHVNQGLWLGDPDLDAITWLVSPVHPVKSWLPPIIVGIDTWAPINSQNTSVRAEAMPAYYFIPMDGMILGQKVDRFGDIFQGYFLQKCMKHMGGHLRIGTPIVDHRRNAHNYFDDAEKEWFCIRLNEELLPWLTEECKLTGSDYCETYDCLSHELESWAARQKQPKRGYYAFGYLQRVARQMREWSKACRTIGVRSVAA